MLDTLQQSVVTYGTPDKVKDPIWDREHWWWKWYDTWPYNFEVRARGG